MSAFLVLVAWGASNAPAKASQEVASQEVGSVQVQIAGAQMVVSPASQTVPFDTATWVQTAFDGYDPTLGVLPAELRVVGDFVGPEVDGVLQLSTLPGEPFRIPRLRVEGQYRLENIRLLVDDEILGYAEPRSADILVTQILLTRVSSRALSLEEIRGYGLALDENSFHAINLTFAYGVAGNTFDFNMPLVYDLFGPDVDILASPDSAKLPKYSDQWNTVKQRFQVPRVVPFTVEVENPPRPEIPVGGCDPRTTCRPELRLVRPMVGAILFPTDISLLHQFFSVVLQVENGAPDGDPAVLRNLFAKVELPSGLRLGETEPPTLLGAPVPIKDPGPDGEVGTADDLNFLVAGASGNAEVLLEGVEQGTHIVRFAIDGVLDGLPTGPQAVQGTAQGAVAVRDPRLQVHIAHPQVVRANVEYSVFLTVSNIGNAPVNLIELALPAHALSGVAMVGSHVRDIDSLDPGESETVEFRVESQRTGKVVSSALRAGSSVDPSFEWSLAVGEDGSLSPDALLLPTTTDGLPQELVKQALALAGVGYSLAKAPPSLGSSLPRVSEEAVNERIYRLGQVGRHLDYGEARFDAIATLSAEWLGARDGDWDWDQLRRESGNGAKLSSEIGTVLGSDSASALDAFERFAATTHFLAPQAGLVVGSGLRLEISSRTSAKAVSGSAIDEASRRELPFADLFDLAQGQMAVMARPEESGYSARVLSDDGGSGALHLLVPDAAGDLRVARFTGFSLGAGGVAKVEFLADDTSFEMQVDADGDGSFESVQSATLHTLARRPFQVLAAVQNDAADPSGHVIDVLFTEDVDLAHMVPRDPSRFEIVKNVSNGGLVPTEADLVSGMLSGNQTFENPFAGINNPRVVKVIFDNPISPLIPNTMQISDLRNLRDEVLAAQDVAIETRSQQQGVRLEGTIYGTTGQPAAGATVVLYESDSAGIGNEIRCLEHISATTTTDASGHYEFDWVRQTPCGAAFRVFAQDPSNGHHAQSRGRVRSIGQTQELDIAMPARGSVVGRVTYEDGSVPQQLEVVVYNVEQNAGRRAHIGADGNFDVAEIIVGQVVLAADDGQGSFAYATLEIPEAGAVVSRDVVLFRHPETPPGSVRGIVETVDSEPVFDAWVALYVDDNLTAVTRTAADGRFDFGLVPAGIARIDAFTEASTHSGERAAQVFFEVRSDATEDLRILVRDDVGTVRGHIYRRGLQGQLTPLAGVVVWAQGTPFNATTDASGFYELEDVFAGTWTIRAALQSTGESALETVTLTSAGGVVDRDLYFDEQLPNGGLLGQVLGYDGNPVVGATVHLAGGHLSYRWHHTATSDAEGRFVIEDLGPGTYGIHAFKGSDGGLGWGEIRFPGETAHATVRFVKGTIRGQTRAPVGQDGSTVGVVSQIAYRRVEVYNPWQLVVVPPDYTYIETDANGFFEIDALAGPYELRVFNAFHGDHSAKGQIDYQGQIAEHDFLFEPNGDVRGVILDHDGQTPVAGVRVNISGGNIAEYDVHTDADGAFHFPLIPPGSYRIEAFHSEGVVFRRASVRATVARPGDQVDGVAIELPIQGTLSGWVEDADGYPVGGAVVTLQESVYPWRKVTQNADEEGNYAFENVFGGGPVFLYGEAPSLGGLGSRATAQVSFEAEDVLTVLTLEPTGDVEGVVTTPVDGSAVARASVELLRSGAFEDGTSSAEDGSFAFRRMPLGWYRAIVFDPATGRRGKSEWVELAAHRDVALAAVELESRGVVEGRFMDGDVNSPLPGHIVTLRTTRWYRVYATTDIDGYFDFGGVPEGDFELWAADSTQRRRARETGQIAYEDEVVTLDLTLAPLSLITGRVHNPVGAAAGLASLINVRLEQGGHVIGAGFDNPFSFEGIVPGMRFTLKVTENGGLRQARASGRIDEAGQDLDFDLTLQALGSVVVNVVDSFGAPVDGASVYVANRHQFGYETFSASTGADNSVTFADVLEGRVTAGATHPNGLLKGSVSGDLSTDGESLVLDVVLQDTGIVRGRVLQSNGLSPAVGAAIALQTGNRWLLSETDALGLFELSSVPMGAFHLVAQEDDGLGTIERFAGLSTNGQIVDYGDLILDDEDPVVMAIAPDLGARDLPLDSTVRITFSEPMDAARLGNAVRLRTISGQNVPIAFSWSADQTELTLTPTQGLASGTGYDIFIERHVYDLAGRDLGWRVRSYFFTADVIPPTVLRARPRNGAVQVPVESSLLLTFSEPVDLSSLSGTSLQLTDLTAGQGLTTTFQLRPGEREVILTPVAPFETDRDIRLTVQGVRDLAGNIMSVPVTITFWTPDTTPPTGSFTAPAAGTSYTAGDSIDAAVDAADDRQVAEVEFRIGEWSSTDTSEPYTGPLLAPVVAAPSDMALEATVRDIFGNTLELSRSIHVEPHVNGQAPTVTSHCWYDGDFVQPGVEIPIQVTVADDERVESYGLYVDGVAVERVTPANVPMAEKTFLWTPPHAAAPGTSFEVKVEARDFAGNLGAVTATLSVPLEPILTSDQVLNQLDAGQDLVLGSGTFTLNESLDLESLRLLRFATLTTEQTGLDLDVVGQVRVQCGAKIGVSGRGFSGGQGSTPGGAPSWVSGSGDGAGGSHGGVGKVHNYPGPAGDIHDSLYFPTQPGGGGGSVGPKSGGAGGGTLHLAADSIVLNGKLMARGADAQSSTGGAGGTIVVSAPSLTGEGWIDASGGATQHANSFTSGGPGGGGRVALHVADLAGFDIAERVLAWGGVKPEWQAYEAVYAAPGSVYVFDASSTFGRLIVANGFEADGTARLSAEPTELPSLGEMVVTGFEVNGDDAWLTTAQTLRSRWKGAWATLLDGGGAELGPFEVIEIDGSGRALLRNAAAVGGAATLRGEYRLDALWLENAHLDSNDPVEASSAELSGRSGLPAGIVLTDLHLLTGSTLRPLPDEQRLELEIPGTLTIEAGAAIDVSGHGSAAGSDGTAAAAPAWVAPSTPDAGGSHGGHAGANTGQAAAGDVFDSVYRPELPGGGGTHSGGSHGGRGGGVLEILAQQVVLDGVLLARGGDGYGGGAGAGGTIRIEAQALAGSGSIDASGGDTRFQLNIGHAGNAGGGRVALWVDDLSQFDLETQTLARQGIDTTGADNHQDEEPPYAAPGTLFAFDSSSTYGRLIINPGLGAGGEILQSAITHLPSLGSGAVSNTEVEGSDLWISAAAAFHPRWSGAQMALVDTSGEDLGLFRVEEIDQLGRCRLGGAAGVAPQVATYRGEYHFDSIGVLRDARLEVGDPLVRETVILSGYHEIDGLLEGGDIVLRAGSLVRSKTFGQPLELRATGSLVIESGALIDVTGNGHVGGVPGSLGATPDGVDGSGYRTGGAHGGLGSMGFEATGQSEVNDSVYRPTLAGSGGGHNGAEAGSNGGGILRLDAASIQLDGEVRARGGTDTGSRSGGAGGTIVIEADAMAGTGIVNVSGGDSPHYWSGYGGGGRVGLYVDDLSGFDLGGVEMRGGGDLIDGQFEAGVIATPVAAPGTLFTFHSTSTYGDLIVDGEFDTSPFTHLPSIGRGLVGTVVAEGPDLWIEPQDAGIRFSVGVVGMWVRIGGVQYPVIGERPDRRGLLLEGAAGAVVEGERYVGFYRFDSVTVRNGARLALADGDDVGTWNVEAGSEVDLIDLDLPTIDLVTPAEGTIFASGESISVSATVGDASGIHSVTFRFDGQSFTDTTAPYGWTVTAPPLAADADLPLEVEAEDGVGNIATLVRQVPVQPLPSGLAPTISLVCPNSFGSGPRAMLAPGTSLGLELQAADDHAVDRVEVYLGGILQTTLAGLANGATYFASVTAPASSTDGEILVLEARAVDASEQTASATFEIAIVDGVHLSSSTTVYGDDASLEGQSVVVSAGTLTLQGGHSFRDLVVLDSARIDSLPLSLQGGLVGHWAFDATDPEVAKVGPDARLGSAVGADANDPDIDCAPGMAPIDGNVCGVELHGAELGPDNDYVAIPADPSLQFDNAYTAAGWVRLDSGGAAVFRPFFTLGADDDVTDTDAVDVYAHPITGELIVLHNLFGTTNQGYARYPVPPQDAFFHLAVTFDGSVVRVYYEGVEQSLIDGNANLAKPQASGLGWLFGKSNHGAFANVGGGSRTQYLDGALDDIRLYDRALSAPEVRTLATGETNTRGVDISLQRDLYVACGGTIDASGLGWPGGDPHGVGLDGSTAEGAGPGVGGSHGGRGGKFDGTGRIYGNVLDPSDPGAGAGGAGASAGGGVVRLAALGDLTIDGTILARGGGEGLAVPHGAGGSIRLDGATFAGLGSIDASGGGSSSASAGGGGGRIAVYAQILEGDGAPGLRASGGTASSAEARGAAGTVFLKLDTQPLGELHIDDHGVVSSQWTEIPSVGRGVIDSVDSDGTGEDGFTDLEADFTSSVVGFEVEVAEDPARRWAITGHEHHGQHLDLDVAALALDAIPGEAYSGLVRFDRVVVSGNARLYSRDEVSSSSAPEIDAEADWLVGHEPSLSLVAPSDGAVFDAGETIQVDAVVDAPLGIRQVVFTFAGEETVLSSEPWSTAFVAPPVSVSTSLPLRAEMHGRDGRTLVQEIFLTVEPTVVGEVPVVALSPCPGDLDRVVAGAAIDLTFTATDDASLESYRVLVNGVEIAAVAGLDAPTHTATVPWTVPASALPDTLYTLRVEAVDYASGVGAAEVRLRVASAGYLSGNQTLDASRNGQDLVLANGTFTLTEPASLSSLVLMDGAALLGQYQVGEDPQQFILGAVGELRVQCGSYIGVSDRGYPRGTDSHIGGYAPPGIRNAWQFAGGSHGGLGRDGLTVGHVGETYGSVYLPHEAGAGGARGNPGQDGSHGGGLMTLDAGSVVLDGALSANAWNIGNTFAGTGAGGGILLRTQSLRGTGKIRAEGGDDLRWDIGKRAGLGGGGRVAIWADTITGFDPAEQVFVQGGSRHDTNGTVGLDAGPGTVFVKTASDSHGHLLIDARTEGRWVPTTPLPSLGTGAVTQWDTASADAWVTSALPFPSRWLGAWMRLADSAGADLGRYRVAELDAAGRALLEGASGVIGASTWSGEYVFDSIRLLDGAGLDSADPVHGGSLDFTESVRAPGALVADSLTVRTGSVLTLASGSTLSLEVSGALVVEAGSVISVYDRGHVGGTQGDIPGQAPAGIARAQYRAGASHGGLGQDGTASGNVGEVYGSPYSPHQPGAGGAWGDVNQNGGTGGGFLTIEAGSVLLEGDLRANGGWVGNSFAGTGAGGTVLLRASSLDGSGTIEARAGDEDRSNLVRRAGLGGGGRVAIWADNLGGFDPTAQVTARGGRRVHSNGDITLDAAPGTVFFADAAAIYGTLVIDAQVTNGRTVPATTLPPLPSGNVQLVEVIDAADPASDLWLTGDSPFPARWLGAWMGLEDSTFQDLGTYRVLEIDASGRALLEAAAGATAASSYSGEYRFDAVLEQGGGSLDPGSPVNISPGANSAPETLFSKPLDPEIETDSSHRDLQIDIQMGRPGQ